MLSDGARGQDVASRLEHAFRDARDLLKGLSLAVDDLRHAVAQMPVMVDMGIGKVLEGQVAQPFERGLDIGLAGRGRFRAV